MRLDDALELNQKQANEFNATLTEVEKFTAVGQIRQMQKIDQEFHQVTEKLSQDLPEDRQP